MQSVTMMAANGRHSKALIIAIIIIAVLVVSLAGVIILKTPNSQDYNNNPSGTNPPTNEPTATPFSTPTVAPTNLPTILPSVSFSPEIGMAQPITQGKSLQVLISFRDLYSEEMKPKLTAIADSESSGIYCTFSGASWFQEWLTINVPTSARTGNYVITINETYGQTSQTTSYPISVLSAQVQVSGTIHFNPTAQPNGEITPSGVQFVELHTNSSGGTEMGMRYAGTITGDSTSGYSYSITVPNGAYYSLEILDSSGQRYNGGTEGAVNIYAPPGSTSKTENLAYPN